MADKPRGDKQPPCIQLRQTARVRAGRINSVAWSPDGSRLATGSDDKGVRLWNPDTGEVLKTLEGHTEWVRTVAWSPDGWMLASGSDDGAIRVWYAESGGVYRTLRGHGGWVYAVAWAPRGLVLAAAFQDGQIRLWDVESGRLFRALEGHKGRVFCIAWSPDGSLLASGSEDQTIFLWEMGTGKLLRRLTGHTGSVFHLAWSPDGKTLASGSGDATVRLWERETGRHKQSLEAHVSMVNAVGFSGDGRLLASTSEDETRLWSCDTWELLASLGEYTPGDAGGGSGSLDFHPTLPLLATTGEYTTRLRLWELDMEALCRSTDRTKSVHYTNAKVVLVGDSGVGKSGLSLVLTGQTFAATESTHGRRVWTLKNEEITRDDGLTEIHETLLWDLAGQPGYRLIHQLHLDEAAVALVVFDARGTDPFAGVYHWNRALRQAQRTHSETQTPMVKFLVAARTDREGIGAGSGRVANLVRDLGFDGYFETSAKEEWNIASLRDAIHNAIAWDTLPRVSSTDLFQRIKNFLLGEKDAKRLLSTVDDLYRAFLKSGEAVADGGDLRTQFETCIRLVESRGLIRRLSFGNLVLLQPELLDAYASSMVNAAKEEPEGLGCLPEEDARSGNFRMAKDERIHNKDQEKLLLIATVEDLLRHEIALREHADDGPQLVFPSQFTKESPELPDPEGKAVSISFEGPVMSVYATLAVRLAHSGMFKKEGMWKNAATYTALMGGKCGLFLREVEEGRGELALFFDAAASEETRAHFETYVLAHLRRRSLPESVQRRRTVLCPECGFVVTDQLMKLRTNRGFDWLSCPVCEARISLAASDDRAPAISSEVIQRMDREADAHREYDAGLVSATAELQTRGFKRWVGSSRTTLALVFTDIVDSTALGNDVGNEIMNELRRTHFTRARQLLAKHNGYEIKTVGDSFLVAFRTAAEAFDFALALFTDTGHARIRIRAGIHIGPVEIEEQDVYGAAVNYAARVTDFRKEAQIFVSEEARSHIDQVRPIKDSPLLWTPHSDCELKGFAGRYTLWSVVAPSDFQN